jgi:hypothetical protein
VEESSEKLHLGIGEMLASAAEMLSKRLSGGSGGMASSIETSDASMEKSTVISIDKHLGKRPRSLADVQASIPINLPSVSKSSNEVSSSAPKTNAFRWHFKLSDFKDGVVSMKRLIAMDKQKSSASGSSQSETSRPAKKARKENSENGGVQPVEVVENNGNSQKSVEHNSVEEDSNSNNEDDGAESGEDEAVEYDSAGSYYDCDDPFIDDSELVGYFDVLCAFV